MLILSLCFLNCYQWTDSRTIVPLLLKQQSNSMIQFKNLPTFVMNGGLKLLCWVCRGKSRFGCCVMTTGQVYQSLHKAINSRTPPPLNLHWNKKNCKKVCKKAKKSLFICTAIFTSDFWTNHAVKVDLNSEKFPLLLKSRKKLSAEKKLPWASSLWVNSARGSDLAPFLWDLSKNEKLSEIELE